jgi:hypothetical protein
MDKNGMKRLIVMIILLASNFFPCPEAGRGSSISPSVVN